MGVSRWIWGLRGMSRRRRRGAGLGFAIAEAFAAEKAIVALVDRDPEVSRAAERISPSRDSIGIVSDVTEYGQIERLREHIQERMGRVDHVVFAAGIGSGKFGFPFWNLDPGDWDNVLRVNLIGACTWLMPSLR